MVVCWLGLVPAAWAQVRPAAGADGWHRGPVEVSLDGFEQHRVDGGPWTPVTAGRPALVVGDGVHTVDRRSGDVVRSVFVRIDGSAAAPAVHALRRARSVELDVRARDAPAGAARVELRVGAGRWRSRSLDEVLFDGTAASLRDWRQAGSGSFAPTGDGALRTVGGLGLLWYAAREFGDAALRLQWREARSDGVPSNAGVFVRFPGASPVRECDVRLPLALGDFAWHAVACGHELQINDGDGDPQRTGSVYAFRPLGADGSRAAPFGAWNDFEVRTTGGGDYEVTIARNGELVNRFVNAPGQSPFTREALEAGSPRALYPGTDVKQFATGFVGLQNHGAADVVEFRDVRVLPLGERRARFVVPRVRRARTVRVRAVDAAGNRSRTVRLRIAGR